jgi:PAS domain S-box-containing protein/diguanylate cyclase (GGDEF)-like protein
MLTHHRNIKASRQSAPYDHDAPDAEEDSSLADVTRLAANCCGAPAALVCLIGGDRHTYKAVHGIDAGQLPPRMRLCDETVERCAPLVVGDAAAACTRGRDPEVSGTPQVVSYAGVPLADHTGRAFGTLCVISNRAGAFTPAHVETLEALARQVLLRAELRRTVSGLWESSDRLHGLLRAGGVGLWEIDIKTGATAWSDSLYEIFGLTPGSREPSPDAWLELVHPDDRERVAAELRRAVVRHDESRTEYRVLQPGGVIRWVVGYSRVFDDPVGRPLRRCGVTIDITRLKRAEEARAQLAAIVESSDDAIVGLTPDGVITSWNLGAEKTYGYAAPEVIGRRVGVLVPAGLDAEISELLAAAAAGRSVTHHETRRVRKDGTIIRVSVNASPVRDAAGNVVGASTIARDITEAKKSEALLRESERRHRQLVENASDMIYQTDASGRFTFVNPQAAERTKYARHELVGKHYLELVRADHADVVRDFYGAQVADRAADTYLEFPIVAKDGTEIWIGQHAQLLVSGGEVVGLQAIARDITDRLLTELATRINQDRLAALVEQKTATLTHVARYDVTTGLPGRKLFESGLDELIESQRGSGLAAAVIALEIDRLRKVSETIGHDAGDEMLREAARRLAACLGEGALISRVGSDQFAAAVSCAGGRGEAEMHVLRIKEAVRGEKFSASGRALHTTASVGYCVHPEDGGDAGALLRNASAALDHAKHKGAGSHTAYTAEINERAQRRLALELSLRRAAEVGEFVVHYQPQVDMSTREIVGVEALVRWQNTELGLVSPAEFIPLAEETGLIVPIGEAVLRAACSQARAWQDRGIAPRRVSVNISGRQFEEPDLGDTIARVLRETGLRPERLDLELTESSIMSNPEASIRTLRALKEMGVTVSVDDFGTGYSSLSYLKRLPLDTLKVDRSFVRDAINNPDDASMVTTIIMLAHTYKLKVIAEGVETEEQFRFLYLNRCDQAQGHLFSRPLPAEEITRLLEAAGREDAALAS